MTEDVARNLVDRFVLVPKGSIEKGMGSMSTYLIESRGVRGETGSSFT